MILFWTSIVFLTVIAVAFVVKPLLSNKNSLRFLEEGLIVKPNYLIVFSIVLLFPLLSISLYWYWGKSELVSQGLVTKNRNEQVKQEIAKFGSRQKIIVALRNKLEQLPRDETSAKGWYLLGQLYSNEKNYTEALQSFELAAKLKPSEPEYLLQFIAAKFYINHKLSSEDEKLLQGLLAQEPNNINAINLLALDAYQQRHFDKAIRYWESLLQYFPVGSDDSKSLIAMIHLAQNQLPENIHASEFSKVNVIVSLSSTLKNKINFKDVLFVYALEAGGSKIPLAAVRLEANNFPIQLKLGEMRTMMPGKSLADADRIYVEARISKSGNALPARGDMVGKSAIISKSSQRQIQIDIVKIIN